MSALVWMVERRGKRREILQVLDSSTAGPPTAESWFSNHYRPRPTGTGERRPVAGTISIRLGRKSLATQVLGQRKTKVGCGMQGPAKQTA